MNLRRCLSLVEKGRPDPGDGPNDESESVSESKALEDPARLRELQESLGRLEDFAAQAQAENTTWAYAADLEDFRHWCKKYGREWIAATRLVWDGQPLRTRCIRLFQDNPAEELEL
jgi:hypothetical protein